MNSIQTIVLYLFYIEQLFMNLFLIYFQSKDIAIHMCTNTHGSHTMVLETSQTTSFQACFFHNTLLHFLRNLLISVPLVSFLQAGEKNQQNNQLSSLIVFKYVTILPITIIYLDLASVFLSVQTNVYLLEFAQFSYASSISDCAS